MNNSMRKNNLLLSKSQHPTIHLAKVVSLVVFLSFFLSALAFPVNAQE